jgi:MFS family permease
MGINTTSPLLLSMDRYLKILLATYGLFVLAGGLLGPIYGVFVRNIGGDLTTAGISYGLFAISAGLLLFFFGVWEDHAKHKEKFVIVGYALAVVGLTGYLFVRNPTDLFIVQIILGLAQAINTPAYDALYSKHLDKGKAASEWGLLEGMDYMGQGIAAIIGGFIAAWYGFEILFSAMAILAAIGFVLSFTLIIKQKRNTHPT